MFDSVRPHKRQTTRLCHPWDSPGKNTGVGCHFLLQCMERKSERKSLSRARLFKTPWTAAHQAPLSMRFSRQEYWSGVPLPSLDLSPWGLIDSTSPFNVSVHSNPFSHCQIQIHCPVGRCSSQSFSSEMSGSSSTHSLSLLDSHSALVKQDLEFTLMSEKKCTG